MEGVRGRMNDTRRGYETEDEDDEDEEERDEDEDEQV
jgi:hypothetical protein